MSDIDFESVESDSDDEDELYLEEQLERVQMQQNRDKLLAEIRLPYSPLRGYPDGFELASWHDWGLTLEEVIDRCEIPDHAVYAALNVAETMSCLFSMDVEQIAACWLAWEHGYAEHASH